MPRKSSQLLLAAWITFAVSLFLPVYRVMVGWQCAASCVGMITELGEWVGIYYFAFTIPNLLMLLSPLLVYCLNKKSRKMNWLNGTALFCALYVVSFGVVTWVTPDSGEPLGIAYYLWVLSFWLLFLGLMFSKRGSVSPETPQTVQAAA